MLWCHQASAGEVLSATRLTVSSLLLSEMSEGIQHPESRGQSFSSGFRASEGDMGTLSSSSSFGESTMQEATTTKMFNFVVSMTQKTIFFLFWSRPCVLTTKQKQKYLGPQQQQVQFSIFPPPPSSHSNLTSSVYQLARALLHGLRNMRKDERYVSQRANHTNPKAISCLSYALF